MDNIVQNSQLNANTDAALAKRRILNRIRQPKRIPRTAAEKDQAIVQKRRKSNVIAGVRPKTASKDSMQSYAFNFEPFEDLDKWEMYLADENVKTDSAAFSLNACNILDSTDGIQVCAFVLGMLCCINHKFVADFPRCARHVGVCVTTVRLPSQAVTHGVDMNDIVRLSTPECIALFGYAILLIFKTPTNENYEHFKTAILGALRLAANVPVDKTIMNPFTLQKAQAVRSILGSSLSLKIKIIETIIAMSGGADPIHAVCRYVSSILEYNEMSAVMFPYETLVLPFSPILTDPRVLNESYNLAEALTLIVHSDYPQFYRYLGDQNKVTKLDRARFPTLAAVGKLLKQESMGHTSVKNIVGNKMGGKGNLVEELVRKHKAEMIRTRPNVLDSIVTNLCKSPGPYATDPDASDEEAYEEEEGKTE